MPTYEITIREDYEITADQIREALAGYAPTWGRTTGLNSNGGESLWAGTTYVGEVKMTVAPEAKHWFKVRVRTAYGEVCSEVVFARHASEAQRVATGRHPGYKGIASTSLAA